MWTDDACFSPHGVSTCKVLLRNMKEEGLGVLEAHPQHTTLNDAALSLTHTRTQCTQSINRHPDERT